MGRPEFIRAVRPSSSSDFLEVRVRAGARAYSLRPSSVLLQSHA
jgi:hypothetical protein